MDELLVGLVYMSFIMGLIGLAALLDLMAEKIPAFGRLIDRLIDRTLLNDDEYEYEYEYEDEEDEVIDTVIEALKTIDAAATGKD